jgi:predicted DCC family thiol-disulfide oxidoreductase YuxK
MSETSDINTKTILFFDGNCGLCNRSVKFVLRKEKNHELFFSPLQSEFAKKTLQKFNLENKADTMLLLENGKINFQSSAALRSTKYLKGLWPAMMMFIIVPPFIRNAIYNYIAKNRITWFGIADYCDMMTPELKKRFIE